MQKNINAGRWMKEYVDQLYRFAYSRTQNGALSEDLVQDTFFSALKSSDKFKGNSSERTWLYSILKNKIIDHYRKASTKKEQYQIDDPDYNEDIMFHTTGGMMTKGSWKQGGFLKSEDAASHLVESKQFYGALENCLDALPHATQMAFRLKHLKDFNTDEVCKELDITASNYWVLLHRARLQLRNCLSNKEV